METQFKILVFGNPKNYKFVDLNRLNRGLYESYTPVVFEKDTTVENIKEIYGYILNKIQLSNFIANLNNCTLIDIEITIKSNENGK